MISAQAVAVLSLARSRGILVEPSGPKLRVVAPDGMPDAEWHSLRFGLAEHKGEILPHLIEGRRRQSINLLARATAAKLVLGTEGDELRIWRRSVRPDPALVAELRRHAVAMVDLIRDDPQPAIDGGLIPVPL